LAARWRAPDCSPASTEHERSPPFARPDLCPHPVSATQRIVKVPAVPLLALTRFHACLQFSPANCSWFFCRLSSMSRAAYSPIPLLRFRHRLGLRPLPTTTPAAGLRGHMPAHPAPYASDPVPSGCEGDFHPRVVEHARHTRMTRRPGGPRYMVRTTRKRALPAIIRS
jgi:hypothetical protein